MVPCLSSCVPPCPLPRSRSATQTCRPDPPSIPPLRAAKESSPVPIPDTATSILVMPADAGRPDLTSTTFNFYAKIARRGWRAHANAVGQRAFSLIELLRMPAKETRDLLRISAFPAAENLQWPHCRDGARLRSVRRALVGPEDRHCRAQIAAEAMAQRFCPRLSRAAWSSRAGCG